MKPASTQNKKWFTLIGVGFFLFYVLGLIWPDQFWATHFLAFLPGWGKILFLFVSGGLVFAPYLGVNALLEKEIPAAPVKFRPFLLLLVAVLFGVFCYSLPIHTDDYGDALVFKAQTNLVIKEYSPILLKDLLFFDFREFKIGEHTFYSLVNMGTWLTGWHGHRVVRLIGVLAGIVYAFLWLVMVWRMVEDRWLRLLFATIGLTAPFLFVFMGHYEVYAIVFPVLMAFFLSLILYFQTQKQAWLWLLIPLQLLALKTHITGYMLFPALICGFVWHFGQKGGKIQRFFTWKWLSLLILLPAAVGGLVYYLGIKQSFNGPRFWTRNDLTEAIFLPVISRDGPPFDRYNLFSFNHFFDYFSLIFVWSAAIVFLLVVLAVFYRKKINWNAPLVLLSGITLFLYLAAYFVLHPLLGLTTDWDLFSLPVPALFVFVLALASQVKQDQLAKQVAPLALGLAILGIPVFWVNHSATALSQRLEHKGIYDFKTYWKGASSPILIGISMEPDPKIQAERRLAVLKKLEPWVVKGKDTEYAALQTEMGLYYSEEAGDLPRAMEYFYASHESDPYYSKNAYYLVIGNFHRGNLEEAFRFTDLLTQVQWPDLNRATKVALHTSLEVGEYEAAKLYCERYWEGNGPEDALIRNVYSDLQSENPSTALRHFRQN